MVTMNDPLQKGTWEIQVTAKGTPRVRVQGKEGDISGKGWETVELREQLSVTFISGRFLTAFDLLSPDLPGLPLLLWDPCGGRTPPWPLPPDSASCRYIYSPPLSCSLILYIYKILHIFNFLWSYDLH